jgi:hypothetical protein
MEKLLGFPISGWDFLAMFIIGVTFLALAIFILGLPGRIAIARNHPEADAVSAMGWVGFLAVVPCANQTEFPIGAQGTVAIYTSGEHGAWAALRKISNPSPSVAELALPDQFLKDDGDKISIECNGWRCQMSHTASAVVRSDLLPSLAWAQQWKRVAFALMLSGLSICLPARGYTAGLDCPETGPGAVPNLLTDVQSKLVMSGDRVDLANEINDLINKLQIEKPNISYAELTNVIVAAYCPVVASMASLTASEKWRRMRQFDTVLQQQIAANTLAPGTLIIANVPLPPAVYRELQSQAAKVDKTPAQLMAAILSRAAGN